MTTKTNRRPLRHVALLLVSAFITLTDHGFAQSSSHHGAAPVEQERDVEGVLSILYEDSPSGARLQYVLDTVEERLSLQFPDGPPPGLASHARIRVHGVQVEGTLIAYSGGTSSSSTTQTSAPAAMPNTFGALRAAVLLVNFRNAPSQPWSPEQVRSAFFTTTSNFFLENSFQQTSLGGDVFGWYTVALDSTVPSTSVQRLNADQ